MCVYLKKSTVIRWLAGEKIDTLIENKFLQTMDAWANIFTLDMHIYITNVCYSAAT